MKIVSLAINLSDYISSDNTEIRGADINLTKQLLIKDVQPSTVNDEKNSNLKQQLDIYFDKSKIFRCVLLSRSRYYFRINYQGLPR